MTLVRLRRALVAAAVVVVGALPGAAGAGGARPIQEGVKLLAVAGFEGWIAPGQPFPVAVTVTTDRLLVGAVQIDLAGFAGRTVVEREFELAGGNTATYHLLVPPRTGEPFALPDIDEVVDDIGARLVVDGEVVAAAEIEGRVDPRQELVGVLPVARAALGAGAELPETVPLLVEAGTARPSEVESELLGLGPSGFAPLDQVVTTPGELADLPKAHRAALLGWVGAGGQLLLSGDLDDMPDATLPEGWLPPAGGGVVAGAGRVRSVSATWLDELLPTPIRSGAEEGMSAQAMNAPMASSSVGGQLSQDAGAVLPPGGRLGVMLALYVVVAGPVVYLGLRRFGRRRAAAAGGDEDDEADEASPAAGPIRRPLAAWAVVPVLAVAGSGVVVGAGGELRRHAASAHVTVYEVGPGGATATTWSLLSNPGRKGAVGLDLPANWTAGATPASRWFQEQSSTVRVRTSEAGVEASTRPPAGGFGMIRSSGPVAGMADALEVTAESAEDDVIRGTVRNRLDVPLEEVVVIVGGSALTEVGTLAAGEEKAFEIEAASQATPDLQPERWVWPDPMDGEGIIGRGGVIRMDPGAVWSDELKAEVQAKAAEAARAAADAQAGVAVGADGVAEGGGSVEIDVVQPEPPAAGPADSDPPPPTTLPEILDDTAGVVIRGGPGQPVPLPLPAEPPMPPDGRPGPPGDGAGVDTPTMMAAWSQLLQERGASFRPNGEVVAVGWTEELDPPVSPSDSGRVSRSRSAVVARSAVQPAGDRLSDAASVRRVVRGRGQVDLDVFVGVTSTIGSFDLPAAVGDRPVDASRLMFSVPGHFQSVDVWTPQGWVALPDVPEGQTGQRPVPAGTVIGGQIFVRWTQPDGLLPGPHRDFVLYEKET